jgi:hypothetical protein
VVKNTGWAHSAGQRTGHYLDAGDPVCGYDPRTYLDELDLRADEAPGACADCKRIVKAAGGEPPHEHRWSVFHPMGGGSPKRSCRCGAQT